jgi:hypothetical protein
MASLAHTIRRPSQARARAYLRAYLAGVGATSALTAGAVVAFLSMATFVAFNGVPSFGGSSDAGAAYLSSSPGDAPSPTAAALGSARGAVANDPGGSARGPGAAFGRDFRGHAAAGVKASRGSGAGPGGGGASGGGPAGPGDPTIPGGPGVTPPGATPPSAPGPSVPAPSGELPSVPSPPDGFNPPSVDPPSLPRPPSLPSAPSLPDAPSLPSAPSLPRAPSLPTPSVPDLPGLP